MDWQFGKWLVGNTFDFPDALALALEEASVRDQGVDGFTEFDSGKFQGEAGLVSKFDYAY